MGRAGGGCVLESIPWILRIQSISSSELHVYSAKQYFLTWAVLSSPGGTSLTSTDTGPSLGGPEPWMLKYLCSMGSEYSLGYVAGASRTRIPLIPQVTMREGEGCCVGEDILIYLRVVHCGLQERQLRGESHSCHIAIVAWSTRHQV